MNAQIIKLMGVVRGNQIELEHGSGLPEGETVTVTLERVPPTKLSAGLLAAFGACADDPEGVDEFVRENYELRKSARNRDIEP